MVEDIVAAVSDLARRSGYDFQVTETEVSGTDLVVVYAEAHPFSAQYSPNSGVLGFRVPRNFPDACPEDSFFIQPDSVRLVTSDPVRNSNEIHRVGRDSNFLAGTRLAASGALIFSWHLWNKCAWDRRTHTLFDHYSHCVRRFDQPEHD